ncbi:TCP-1/cpn60 chaperonin family protein [Calderihabitans maritimus]|uniref:Chaperonin n=1 Tax=Calderihabitans maritimus TaxID=1246530 RepID=A0A1Z5HV90_9FIRM|nr:TCP-1/cpn60 chaperonin family protein [Calderihabitans maritimus]GAW93453.1 chaperonin [Calderihabitans maritimus]
MSLKQVNRDTEVDERLAALMTNANAVRAVASAVEGTIGPKGLDTMLVDKFGEVVITNDGVTILDLMEVNHPAAKMLVKTAKSQQEQVGDGTTTATLIAGSLVNNGVEQVVKGVPVVRIIEGIRAGVKTALAFLQKEAQPLDINDPLLKRVALIAGREHEDIAELTLEAARLVGKNKLLDPNFKLLETVVAEVGAKNEVFQGVVINRTRMNRQMPAEIMGAKVLAIDDALEPEEIEEEALATEAGFNRFLQLQEEFRNNIQKIVELGVKLVIVDRSVSDAAEEILSDAGVMVLQRVSNKELRKAAEHTGARLIKRTGLKKDISEIEKLLGWAERVYEDEKLEHVRILGGAGESAATILVGAGTEEVVGERERIAKDAAAAVQAAIQGGIVAGGGAIELAAAREVEKERQKVRGMAAFGVDCVIEALKRPFSQIVSNAGFNPLEKVEEVWAAQAREEKNSLGVDCDTGDIVDMLERGIVDPAPVKIHALRTAGEVAEAILRIDTIIKKKETDTPDGRGKKEL